MRLRYARTATADIDDIFHYISERDVVAAEATVRRIEDAVRGLLQYFMRGRVGRVVGTRELVVARSSYVVAYRLNDSVVEILAVLDGHRRWPDTF